MTSALCECTAPGTHSTNIEDPKNSIQLGPPTHNLSLDVARSKIFNQPILPGLFVNLLLYFPNISATKSVIGGGLEVCITRSTHVSNRVIAWRTGSLSSSFSFPPVPRLSASQTSAQSSPRSTQSWSLAILSWLCLSLGRLVHGRG